MIKKSKENKTSDSDKDNLNQICTHYSLKEVETCSEKQNYFQTININWKIGLEDIIGEVYVQIHL